jgi:hypothetical protein
MWVSLFFYLLLISFGLCSDPVFAQENTSNLSDDLIEWSKENRLQWKDYKLRNLKRRNDGMAITTVRISARGYLEEEVPDFVVKAIFVKSDSWTSDSTDMALLSHEQLHFDIGELYAQKIRLKIDELKAEGELSAKVYRGAINNLITLFKAYSGQYDNETNHGTNRERQLVWEKRMNKLIY